MNDVHKCISNDTEDGVPFELSNEHLNVCYGMYPYDCESHGGNDKVNANISNGMEKISTRVSFLVCQTRIYTNLRMDLGIWKIRDTSVSFLCSKNGKNLANHFVAWNQDSHDLTQNPPRSLDHCLIDECVGDVSI